MTREDKDEALIDVFDPLLEVAMRYANRMRDGSVPVDKEAWILIRRALHAGFEIPEGTFPDDPRELEEPLRFNSSLEKEPIH